MSKSDKIEDGFDDALKRVFKDIEKICNGLEEGNIPEEYKQGQWDPDMIEHMDIIGDDGKIHRVYLKDKKKKEKS